MKNKILYTDIDGVLNSKAYENKLGRRMIINGAGDFPDIDPEAMKRMNRIIEATGCDVILSSGWRFFPNMQKFIYKSGLSVFPGIVDTCGRDRGFEILSHVQKRNNVYSYAILDDNDFTISEIHGSHFIKTNFDTGLTDADADNVINILNNKNL